MRIAITSQNRRQITDHAGKCRNFWIYDIEDGHIAGKQLIELAREQTLHESGHRLDDALAGIQVLISAGMSGNLQLRLQACGIRALVTELNDPDAAIAAYIAGTHPETPLPLGTTGCHSHDHEHAHDHNHGHHGQRCKQGETHQGDCCQHGGDACQHRHHA